MKHELRIERLGQLGEGVAHLEGKSVFVEGGLPGERVLAEVLPHGKVLRGELLEVLEPSAARRSPGCEVAGQCGGCDWLHLDEKAQREAKVEIVLSALEHMAGIKRSSLEIRPVAHSPRAMGYRRRAVLHPSSGRLGFYGRRSHELVGIDRCPALTQPLSQTPRPIAEALGGVAKEVETLTLLAEGEQLALAMFFKGALKPRFREAAERAVTAAGARGAVLVPKDGTPELIGKPVLRSLPPLHPEIPLFLRPDAFAQANAEGNVALVTSAVYELGVREGDRVLELYCGNGNFTFAISQLAREVIGVESAPVSLGLAQKSAAEARVKNVRFIQGDAVKVARGLIDQREQFDLLLLDPPRTGAAGAGKWAKALGVRRAVYVACDPASLARDADELVSAGFTPKALQIVDMFPQTHHVEAVMSFDAAPRQESGEPRPPTPDS